MINYICVICQNNFPSRKQFHLIREIHTGIIHPKGGILWQTKHIV